MAITAAQVVVSSSAIALAAAADSARQITLKNTHATDAVVVGASGVTTSTGLSLAAGATLQVALKQGDELYGIRAGAADVTVHVIRS